MEGGASGSARKSPASFAHPAEAPAQRNVAGSEHRTAQTFQAPDITDALLTPASVPGLGHTEALTKKLRRRSSLTPAPKCCGKDGGFSRAPGGLAPQEGKARAEELREGGARLHGGRCLRERKEKPPQVSSSLPKL